MQTSRKLCACFVVTAAVCAIATGCGEARYQDRLSAAEGYFKFLGTQNKHLDATWKDPESGIELRVPKQLKFIPGPTPAAEGSPAPARDPRQPDYLGIEFPGLIGAWRGVVGVDVNGKQQPGIAYLYVLSNSALLQQKGKEADAEGFHDDVRNLLCQAIKVEKPEDNKWTTESFPRLSTYLEPKQFHWLRLEPTEPIEGIPTDFFVYEHQNEEARVTLLYVIPQQMSSSEALHAAKTVSLETLSIPAQAPQQSAPAGASGAAPAAGRRSF